MEQNYIQDCAIIEVILTDFSSSVKTRMKATNFLAAAWKALTQNQYLQNTEPPFSEHQPHMRDVRAHIH